MQSNSGVSRVGVLAVLAALAMLSACGDLPTGGSSTFDQSAGTPSADEALAISFDEMSTQASLQGDAEAASDYADGALAIRLGVRPTEIAVMVDGQGYRYYAVVTGIVERAGDGPELLKRTLFAWTGDRPEAVLRITSRSDEATFARDENVNDLGKAIGRWNDLVRHARFLAIDGVANTGLKSIAGPCPVAQRDVRFECNLARFELRTDGTYELAGDVTARHQIASSAANIGGVVLKRTDGGRGGRPTVSPSRPMPNR
jgi:hypothetical protein